MKRKSYTGQVKIDLIKKYMKANKLSQKRFAQMCNISINTLRYILSDRCNFAIDNLFKIADVMGICFINLIKN